MIPQVTINFLDVFKPLFDTIWRYIVLYGGRSSGKSKHTALALILRARMSRNRILCTREIQNTIKDSVYKLLKDIIEENGFDDFTITADSIVNTVTGSEFIFKGLKHNIMEIKSMEGIDICWVEEAQSLSKESIEILTPTIRKEGSQIIFTFNRYDELDPVYVKFVMNKPTNTCVIFVNYDVLERAGMLPDVIKQEIEDDRAFPELFAYKWLGEPVGQSESAILGRGQVLAAMQREVDEDGAIEAGVDVARMGSDRTVLTKRKGLRVLEYKTFSKMRTTEICDQIEEFINYDKEVLIKIDDTGVGGGVTDEMMKRKYRILPVNFGERPADKDKYSNRIGEAWFYMQEIIEKIKIPFDQDLLMELTTRQWKHDTKGRRCVESKQEYKKRGFRSPDIADSVILSFIKPLPPENVSIFGPVLIAGSTSRII